MIVAYFDGLCEDRNPGGYACGGWYIPRQDGIPEVIAGGRLYVHGPPATNNVADGARA